jgi:hypothetical protein
LEGVARFNKGGSRLKTEKSLDIWEIGSFSVVVAEIVQISKGEEVKSAIFRPLGLRGREGERERDRSVTRADSQKQASAIWVTVHRESPTG